MYETFRALQAARDLLTECMQYEVTHGMLTPERLAKFAEVTGRADAALVRHGIIDEPPVTVTVLDLSPGSELQQIAEELGAEVGIGEGEGVGHA